MKLLITGANGFVGKALCADAIKRGFDVRGATRSVGELPVGVESCAVGEIDGNTDWTDALSGVEVVIHLAARVHVMKDHATDPLAEFLKVNLYGTENIAQQAARAGVKRLVYVSSIKVNGEETFDKKKFTEADAALPQDAYGISKWEAEQALHHVAQATGLELVILRPPLVYGAGVKGNFAQMLKVIAKGVPLPLASINNLRSLIYVENLVDALIVCATHPAATGQTYLLSDGEDVATPDLLKQLGLAMGHCARVIPCPSVLLKLAGRLIGKSDQIERLIGSLQINSSKIRHELNWQPPYSLQQGLKKTGESFAALQNHNGDDERGSKDG